jgi:hypothetical protein
MSRLLDSSVVKINQLCQTWAEKMGMYRFFGNPDVEASALSSAFSASCGEISTGGHYLVIQDTTQPNFNWNKKQIKPGSGLGVIGDGQSQGFFLHPSLVVRAQDEACMGFSHVHHWIREGIRPKEERAAQIYKEQPIEEKESYRWVQSMERARVALKGADMVTHIQDREGDIFELLSSAADAKSQFIVRSRDDRNVMPVGGKEGKLFPTLQAAPLLGVYSLEIRGDVRKKRVGRTAVIEVRAVEVTVNVPKRLKGKCQPVRVWAVEARESPDTVPAGEKPVLWRLLTSHPAGTFEKAVEVIYFYSLRWYIETLFRLLKTDGYDIESCELETGDALILMTYLCLFAALRCMCLLLASKDDFNQQSVNELFDQEEIECLEKLGGQLNGNTPKQSNPHATHSLKWAFWIIARLGGWSGFASQRPPGVITLHNGLQRFNTIFIGWKVAKDVYKP